MPLYFHPVPPCWLPTNTHVITNVCPFARGLLRSNERIEWSTMGQRSIRAHSSLSCTAHIDLSFHVRSWARIHVYENRAGLFICKYIPCEEAPLRLWHRAELIQPCLFQNGCKHYPPPPPTQHRSTPPKVKVYTAKILPHEIKRTCTKWSQIPLTYPPNCGVGHMYIVQATLIRLNTCNCVQWPAHV